MQDDSNKPKRLSTRLRLNEIYTRVDLRKIIDTRAASLNNGVFRPTGFDSVLLFVTHMKTSDRTQYDDALDGDTLRFQGQTAGLTDPLIIEHRARGLELLLFYRDRKDEYANGGFRYEGVFDHESHHGGRPTDFTLRRAFDSAVLAETSAELDAMEEAQERSEFDPTSIEDARKKTFAAIVMRQGQPAFRRELLDAYEGRCALTDCDVVDVLEAAHICRYKGKETNDVRNGLLLRADIHTLYDRALIAIDPASHEVLLFSDLMESKYASLKGRVLRLPKAVGQHPSQHALLTHLNLVRSIWDERAKRRVPRDRFSHS